MSNPSYNNVQESGTASASHVVHALMRFAWVVRRRKLVVIAAIGVCCFLGLLYFATATRIYEATASLLVLVNTGPDAVSMSPDRTIQDQMATYEILLTKPEVLEGAIRHLRNLPPEIDRRKPRERWVDDLRRMLTTNTVRRTSIIDIFCHSSDPEAGTDVVGAVVQSYLDFIERSHSNVATEIVARLDEERIKLYAQMEDKRKQLLEAKHRGGDIGTYDGSAVDHPIVQRVMHLNQELLKSEQSRVRLEASLSAIHQTLESGGDLSQHLLALEPLVGRDLILSAVGLNARESNMLAVMERQLVKDRADLQSMQDDAFGPYGPAHPKVRAIAERIHSTQEYLASHQEKLNQRLAGIRDPQLGALVLNVVEQNHAQTWAYEQQLARQFKAAEAEAIALNDRMATIAIVEHDLEQLGSVYDALVNQMKNVDINKTQADVRVSPVAEPSVSASPVSPLLGRVLMVCILCGTGGGLFIVYVMDVLDDRFRSPEELQDQLGVPVLAMVRRHAALDGNGIAALQVCVAPDAVESESFRTLRTTLAFSGRDASRLSVTSSEPGDGKTTVLANLGSTYAQAGKKTLLIDGDLRRPGLTRLFDMRGESGLSDILRSDENIAEMCMERIRVTGVAGLDVLPCGSRHMDPAELLGGERCSELLAWAETVYDQVLVDSPPILAASDAAIIGRLIDGVIVVVQPQKNHRRRVLRAVEGLSVLDVNLLGVVVNGISHEASSDYYGYGSDYGYGYGYGYGRGYSDQDEHHDERPAEDVGDTATPSVPAEDTPRPPDADVVRPRRRAA